MTAGSNAPVLRADEVEDVVGAAADHLQVETLYVPVASATRGVWRVGGPRRSAILKELGPATETGAVAWRASADPDHPFYWRREADAYASGVLADLPPGLRAPVCYRVDDREDGTTAIWLEDVQGALPPSCWDRPQYCAALRAFGRIQAAWIDAAELGASWLSRGWLRTYVERHGSDGALLHDTAVLAHPLVLQYLDAEVLDGARRLWEDREQFLTRLDTLPITLNHFDFRPHNVLADDDDLVLIDWAFAGVGALGSDAGPFAFNAAFDHLLDATQLEQLWPHLLEAYRQGLEDDGRGGSDQAEFGFAAAAALKFAWILPAVLRTLESGATTLNGRPIEEVVPRWVALYRLVLASGDRAARLWGTAA